MKKNLLAVIILLLSTVAGKAQIYADSVISSSGVTAPKKAVNENDTDYAIMSTVIGVEYQSKLKLGFHPDGMGGMSCAIKVQPVNGLISANLLQSLSVSLYNRKGKKVITHNGFTLADADLLTGTENIYIISIGTDEDINNISAVEITLSGSASISYRLRIYNAHLSFSCPGSSADAVLNYNHVQHAENVITTSKNDYALMSPSLSGSSFLSVHFDKPKTNRIRYILGKEGLIDFLLLSNIQLTVYGTHNEVIASQNGFTLAEIDILANNKFSVSLRIPQGSDEVTKAKIVFTGYGNELSTLQVYKVTANNISVQKKPHITPDENITFCGQDSAKLVAHPSYNGQNVSWQWYRNNNPVEGATENVYYATQRGEYYVMVTSENNCSNISDEVEVVKQNCASANQTESNSLLIYPNPFSGSARLQLNNIAPGTVTITDKSGKVVETFKTIANQSVAVLASASPGIYFINFTTADGKTYMAKAIKQ